MVKVAVRILSLNLINYCFKGLWTLMQNACKPIRDKQLLVSLIEIELNLQFFRNCGKHFWITTSKILTNLYLVLMSNIQLHRDKLTSMCSVNLLA